MSKRKKYDKLCVLCDHSPAKRAIFAWQPLGKTVKRNGELVRIPLDHETFQIRLRPTVCGDCLKKFGDVIIADDYISYELLAVKYSNLHLARHLDVTIAVANKKALLLAAKEAVEDSYERPNKYPHP